ASFTPRSILPERSFFTDGPILNSCSCFACSRPRNSEIASQSSWHLDQLHERSCYGVRRDILLHDGSCSHDTALPDSNSIHYLASEWYRPPPVKHGAPIPTLFPM